MLQYLLLSLSKPAFPFQPVSLPGRLLFHQQMNILFVPPRVCKYAQDQCFLSEDTPFPALAASLCLPPLRVNYKIHRKIRTEGASRASSRFSFCPRVELDCDRCHSYHELFLTNDCLSCPKESLKMKTPQFPQAN